jgi:hypothetical protein
VHLANMQHIYDESYEYARAGHFDAHLASIINQPEIRGAHSRSLLLSHSCSLS